MCFLLLHHRVVADHPIVLMATRDERYDRPFLPPRMRAEQPGVVAPLDVEAGGSWIGTNEDGLVVALTNRGRPLGGAALRSRGKLVLDLLDLPTVPHALRWLETHLAATAYEGFHILLADADQALALAHDASREPTVPRAAARRSMSGGSHVVSSLHELGEVEPPAEALPGDDGVSGLVVRMERLARDDRPRLPHARSILKHDPERGRGTVCAATIVLAEPNGAIRWRFAPGPPDRTPFRELGH